MKDRESPLRIEVNPWTLDDTLLDVMQLRGAYIAAMGMIETILTELAIRTSKDANYEQLRTAFPSRRPDRLQYLRELTRLPGPLHPYRSLVETVLNRYEEGLALRDILAHGRMRVLSGPGADASIRLEDYRADGPGIALRAETHNLGKLRVRVHAATRMSRAVAFLYHRLGDRLPQPTD